MDRHPRKHLCDRRIQDLPPSTCRPALKACWSCPPLSLHKSPEWVLSFKAERYQEDQTGTLVCWGEDIYQCQKNFHNPVIAIHTARLVTICNTKISFCAGYHDPDVAESGTCSHKARNKTPLLRYSWQFAMCWDFIFRDSCQIALSTATFSHCNLFLRWHLW